MTSSSIKEVIKFWALNEPSMPKSSLTNLLKLIHPFHNELPKSSKTLLPCPKLEYNAMGKGEYVHFPNWISALKSVLTRFLIDEVPTVNYQVIVNIDGLPLFTHSPDYKLYPILLSVYSIAMRPICVGVYCTNKSNNREMPDLTVFLKDFLRDMNCLHTVICENVTFKLSNCIFVCDAPARASLKCIKSHSGYSSCERCNIVGEFHSGHVCLLPITESNQLRTNSSFFCQSDSAHHKGISILSKFKVISMVSGFVLDYMHLICLGIMKRLLLWWKGTVR
ncbi:uncharacterized protein LOC144745231 [Ciona intestinalis]